MAFDVAMKIFEASKKFPVEERYSPRNGSWLNVTEIELSVLHQQCLKRRIDNPHTLEQEIAAWQYQRNLEAAQVRWRFTTVDASIKLSHLYPTH